MSAVPPFTTESPKTPRARTLELPAAALIRAPRTRKRASFVSAMFLKELVLQGWQALMRDRTRSALTMALGATRQSVAQMVFRQGSLVIGIGLGVGLLLAFPAARLIRSFLYEVRPLDGWTYASVVLMLPAIGLAAALLPARKAASIQPIEALRED